MNRWCRRCIWHPWRRVCWKTAQPEVPEKHTMKTKSLFEFLKGCSVGFLTAPLSSAFGFLIRYVKTWMKWRPRWVSSAKEVRAISPGADVTQSTSATLEIHCHWQRLFSLHETVLGPATGQGHGLGWCGHSLLHTYNITAHPAKAQLLVLRWSHPQSSGETHKRLSSDPCLSLFQVHWEPPERQRAWQSGET